MRTEKRRKIYCTEFRMLEELLPKDYTTNYRWDTSDSVSVRSQR